MDPLSLREICLDHIGEDIPAYNVGILPQELKDDVRKVKKSEWLDSFVDIPIIKECIVRTYRDKKTMTNKYYVEGELTEISISHGIMVSIYEENHLVYRLEHSFRFKNGQLSSRLIHEGKLIYRLFDAEGKLLRSTEHEDGDEPIDARSRSYTHDMILSNYQG